MSRTAGVAEDSLAAPEETAPIVRFEGVGMRYGRSPEVLRDISFEPAGASRIAEMKTRNLPLIVTPQGRSPGMWLRACEIGVKPITSP